MVERIRDGHSSSLGAASGVVAGLVAGLVAIAVGAVAGVLCALAFSFLLTLGIGIAIEKTMGFRISEEDEVTGIDTAEHAESGYDFASLGGAAATTRLTTTEGVRA